MLTLVSWLPRRMRGRLRHHLHVHMEVVRVCTKEESLLVMIGRRLCAGHAVLGAGDRLRGLHDACLGRKEVNSLNALNEDVIVQKYCRDRTVDHSRAHRRRCLRHRLRRLWRQWQLMATFLVGGRAPGITLSTPESGPTSPSKRQTHPAYSLHSTLS
jgi:hypothetical protein